MYIISFLKNYNILVLLLKLTGLTILKLRYLSLNFITQSINKKDGLMKIITITIILSLFAVGCAPQIQPSFENSNQRFIEKTISKLDIDKELKDKINTTDRIALLSIEPPYFQHKPIIAMIEDQVIASLIQKGYTLVERDAEAIQKMIREAGEKYSLTFKIPSENITYKELTGGAPEPGINFLETKLISADIAIFYRILEVGIIYMEDPEDDEYVKREALISLHIRIQNIQTGEIIHATNLTSKSSDLVEEELVDRLASFHYTFFPYEYPIQKNMKDESIQEDSPQKNESESPFQNIFFLFQKNK